MSARHFVERLGQLPEPGHEGPEKKVSRVEYSALKFGATTAEAAVFLECGHYYSVVVDKDTNKFHLRYPCQRCLG